MSNLSIDQAEKIRKILARVSSPAWGEAQIAAQKVYEMLNRHSACLEDLAPKQILFGVRDVGFDEYAEKCQTIWAFLKYRWKPYINPEKLRKLHEEEAKAKQKETPRQDPPKREYRENPRRETPRQERPRADYYGDSSGNLHRNHFTGEAYQGKNQDILEEARLANGWTSYEWAGFQQIAKAGLSIKGQKSTLIEKWFPILDANGDPIKGKMGHKILRVFNMSQVQGEYTGKSKKWKAA